MKICLWGNVSGALSDHTPGGAELQIALLAKSLVRIGHEVVILDHSVKEDYVTKDGIKIISINGWNKGIKFLRLFTHRLPNLYKSLINQKADIYYCRMRDFRHIVAVWAAHQVKAKFIYAIADGLDALGLLRRCKYEYLTNIGGLWWFFNIISIEILYPKILHKSDCVFVQHEGQRKVLQDKRIDSIIFPNLFDTHNSPSIPTRPNGTGYIYVGSIAKNKGFKAFYEVVKRTPTTSFNIVGQPRDKLGNRYYKQLKSYSNVYLHGRLSHSETIALISNSKALISTSLIEGFPNVFIEAWACGIPVLSLYVDPGNVLENEKLGRIYNGDLDKLINELPSFKVDENFPTRAMTYVEQNHILNDKKYKDIDKIFESL